MPESINDAIVECVKACGGSKVVGPKLWPEKPFEAAQRALLDCLNPDRPAHLTPEQLVFVLRMAREIGYHCGVEYLMESLDYTRPAPTDPRDELSDLLRQSIELKKQAARRDALIEERIERLLQAKPAIRSVA